MELTGQLREGGAMLNPMPGATAAAIRAPFARESPRCGPGHPGLAAEKGNPNRRPQLRHQRLGEKTASDRPSQRRAGNLRPVQDAHSVATEDIEAGRTMRRGSPLFGSSFENPNPEGRLSFVNNVSGTTPV